MNITRAEKPEERSRNWLVEALRGVEGGYSVLLRILWALPPPAAKAAVSASMQTLTGFAQMQRQSLASVKENTSLPGNPLLNLAMRNPGM